MKISRSKWTSCSVIAAILLGGAPSLRAQSTAHNSHALNVIFGNEYLATDVPGVRASAADLAPVDRFDFLADWVLPGDHRASFRVVADFSPTHPAPTAEEFPETGFRIPSGGEIISPALDLIDTAETLGRLDELRQRVALVTTDDRIEQLTLLALIDMARDDSPSAQKNLSDLFALLLPEGETVAISSDPALLCVHAVGNHPELSQSIVDVAYRVAQSYLPEYERTAWQRQYSAAFARVQRAADDADADSTDDRTVLALSRWTPASPPRARYRGTGAPIARWVSAEGRADNLSSHDQDFLYYAVPLRGNYEVECDVTGFGWRDSSLLVAGKWVGPVYDHKSYDRAGVDGFISRIEFAPQLTKTGDYIHYRTVVRKNAATTYFNGRRIHAQPLTPHYDPWLAVRSAARQDGGVRNLRITGEPVVPEELRLVTSDDLTAWVPYYDEVVGIDWRYHDEAGELQALRNRAIPRHSAQESALFYHRPMLEDGSIEYEFWYEPGGCEAHPALDRLCFLIRPDGVRLHWLTDDTYDRTGLAPDNLVDDPGIQDPGIQSGPLPLRDSDWNHVKLTVRGDTVDLLLNGESICERQIESTNQRHFGLFRYADRTALRVRNVIWKGDWPREVPDLNEQELVDDETGFLDERLPELTALFTHDFVTDGLPLDRFAIVRGDAATDVTAGLDGLRLTRTATGGYHNATVAPNLTVSGDFDITASFDQLQTDPRSDGSSNLFLLAISDNETADEAMIIRRHTLRQGTDDQIIQCCRVYRPDGQDRRHYFARHAAESRAGTFRLARRGERIYHLFAENDSEQFRLIGEEECPPDDLQLQGVRLVAQIYGTEGSIDVLWKSLTIRAESLGGPAVNPDDNPLLELNRERSLLSRSVAQDFTRTPPDADLIRRWAVARDWSPADDGLLIVHPGTDNWTSSGAALQRQIEGDFDVTIRFDPLRVDAPAQGQTTAVYLQMELGDAASTQLSLVFQRLEEDATEVLAQLSAINDQGGRSYRRLGRLGASTVEGLRLARRGRQITCIALSEQQGGEAIVARGDVGDAPINPDCTRIMVHTGGAGRESHIVWKSIDVRADRIVE